MFFLPVCDEEASRMEVVLAELERDAAGKRVVQLVNDRGGVCQESMPELLEARVAHELVLANREFAYEYATGVGNTTVDFLVEGHAQVLLEVASLRDSEGVKSAYRSEGPFTTFHLSSDNLRDAEREMQSIEAEVVVLQRKLGEKVYASGRPIKFPEPQDGRYHVILMDVRRLFGGGEDMRSLVSELRLACFGHSDVAYVEGHRFRIGAGVPDGTGNTQHLRGIFEDGSHPIAAVPWLRSRIHAIHFVCETRFTAGELSGEGSTPSIAVMANPFLLPTKGHRDAFREAYPLMPKR